MSDPTSQQSILTTLLLTTEDLTYSPPPPPHTQKIHRFLINFTDLCKETQMCAINEILRKTNMCFLLILVRSITPIHFPSHINNIFPYSISRVPLVIFNIPFYFAWFTSTYHIFFKHICIIKLVTLYLFCLSYTVILFS